MSHIVILGWGSLLWDKRPDFDKQHLPWNFDGPELRVEFSRVSQTRGGALTLVVDPANGVACRVAYARSLRGDPDDVICDLRSREGTTRSNIGFYFADGSRSYSKSDPVTLSAVSSWAADKAIDVVVWTALESNFEKVCGRPFTVDHAISHLRMLDTSAKPKAVEYLLKAPKFIVTPLRTALVAEPWFKPQSNANVHGSFDAWVAAEVAPLADSRVRLDGLSDGGNRAIFGRFMHLGRKWEVHGDTRVEKVLRAYNVPGGLVVERATARDCLNLAPSLRRPKEPKHFYVYETK